jgi:hypothetical protein
MSINPKREQRVRKRNADTLDVPGVLEFLSKEGNTITWMVTKPSPRDILTIRHWVREQITPKTGSIVPFTPQELASFPAKERKIILEAFARDRAKNGRPREEKLDEAEVMELLLSRDGIVRMIHLSAKKHQPSLTLEQVNQLITEDNCVDIHRAWEQVTNDDEDALEDSKIPKQDGST